MNTALTELEQELLVEGLDDYVGLWEFVWLAHRDQPRDSAGSVRARVTKALMRVLEDGYMEAGDLRSEGGFAHWQMPWREALARIESEWDALPREPTIGDICWLSNTATGGARARELVAAGATPSPGDAAGER